MRTDKLPRVQVKWDISKSFHIVDYDPTNSIFDIELVDPSTIVPAIEPFSIGDLVQLHHLAEEEARNGESTREKDLSPSSLCLAKGSIGLVVQAIQATVNANPMFSVVDLQTGVLKDFSEAALVYADGSDRGLNAMAPSTSFAGGHSMVKRNDYCPRCGMSGPSCESGDMFCKFCKICISCCCQSTTPRCSASKVYAPLSTHKIQKKDFLALAYIVQLKSAKIIKAIATVQNVSGVLFVRQNLPFVDCLLLCRAHRRLEMSHFL